MLQLFNRDVFVGQTIERFMSGRDAAFIIIIIIIIIMLTIMTLNVRKVVRTLYKARGVRVRCTLWVFAFFYCAER